MVSPLAGKSVNRHFLCNPFDLMKGEINSLLGDYAFTRQAG